MSEILENEFNNFFNKILKSKLEWLTNFHTDFEKLLVEYPKIYAAKMKVIDEKYEEELKELELNIIPSKSYTFF